MRRRLSASFFRRDAGVPRTPRQGLPGLTSDVLTELRAFGRLIATGVPPGFDVRSVPLADGGESRSKAV